jgi:hypothetical protein
MKHGRFQWTVLVLLISCLLPLHAAKVYRWTDNNGNVVFSDKPREGAETIEVREPHTYKSVPTKQITPTEKPGKKAFSYTSFKIAKPGEKETLWHSGGNVSVMFQVEPALKIDKGHKIVFSLDGGATKKTTSLNYLFTTIDRGTHTIQAQIKDSNNKPVSSTESVTFFLKRHSVLLGPGKKKTP